ARTRRLLAEDDAFAGRAFSEEDSLLNLGPSIFDSGDCAFIRRATSPSFARKFQEERTVLALAWLRHVRSSANRLMRHQSEAARGRADLRVADEVRLAREFVVFHLAVAILYCAVSLVGPFRVAALARRSISLAGRLRRSTGELDVTAAPVAP